MILDFSRIDTTPGAIGSHAFLAPPARFTGNDAQYMGWLRGQWDVHPGIRQYLTVAVMHKVGTTQSTSTILGPYAEGLTRVLRKLRNGAILPVANQQRLDLAS